MTPIPQSNKAFTLIELMIVVAIIGILSAVAVPAFIRYIQKSKTTEATSNLRKIYDGEITYYDIDHLDAVGNVLPTQFAAAGPEPATVPPGRRVIGNWADQGWTLLHFGSDSAVHYRYTAVTAGTGTTASFTARAEGDLDNDGVFSTYERTGSFSTTTGEAVGSAGFTVVNELE